MADPFLLRWRVPGQRTDTIAAAIGPQGRSAAWIEGVVGNGVDTEFTIEHDLGTFSVGVEIIENGAPYRTKIADVSRPTANSVRIVFGTAPTPDQYRFILHGPPGSAGQ